MEINIIHLEIECQNRATSFHLDFPVKDVNKAVKKALKNFGYSIKKKGFWYLNAQKEEDFSEMVMMLSGTRIAKTHTMEIWLELVSENETLVTLHDSYTAASKKAGQDTVDLVFGRDEEWEDELKTAIERLVIE